LQNVDPIQQRSAASQSCSSGLQPTTLLSAAVVSQEAMGVNGSEPQCNQSI